MDFTAIDVERISIGRRPRGCDIHAEEVVVWMPFDAIDDAGGQLRNTDRRTGYRNDDMHRADAVLIRDVGDAPAILHNSDVRDCTILPGRHRLRLLLHTRSSEN